MYYYNFFYFILFFLPGSSNGFWDSQLALSTLCVDDRSQTCHCLECCLQDFCTHYACSYGLGATPTQTFGYTIVSDAWWTIVSANLYSVTCHMDLHAGFHWSVPLVKPLVSVPEALISFLMLPLQQVYLHFSQVAVLQVFVYLFFLLFVM